MSRFQNATFYNTIAHLADLPKTIDREVAFVGRSNAGKSSAINTIVGHKRLAYTSKTPGRTQHLNFFQLRGSGFFVDLPGYGYAKTPHAQREGWDNLIGGYLRQRSQLVGLVVIMDVRHPLQPLDDYLIQWFLPTGRPIHVLLSKADKLTRQQQTKTLTEVQERMSAYGDQCTVQLFSSLKRTGVDVCEKVLMAWLFPDEMNG